MEQGRNSLYLEEEEGREDSYLDFAALCPHSGTEDPALRTQLSNPAEGDEVSGPSDESHTTPFDVVVNVSG